ncbi:hypothetical protein MAPG_00148 [Magnaporthiopsis poae ATCC 64411]|uniref:Domain of unknown function at the cortex 1 domain-containing protein n=1 Tax=Magnaporthiopsis poae (strain ATCC 64411 / 73-15) TaxID=644358 RepID=A0A0C4DK85_MAGP6|nr:hypothetical protein MAPG_00148 [Magnaporthiopsis poae ATCC 64411]
MAHNYIIRVTAGTVRDVKEHAVVPVNTADPLHITSDLIDARLSVRVKNYGGLPRGSPADSPYFSVEPHAYNNDQYSIAFSFKLKRPPGPATQWRKAYVRKASPSCCPSFAPPHTRFRSRHAPRLLPRRPVRPARLQGKIANAFGERLRRAVRRREGHDAAVRRYRRALVREASIVVPDEAAGSLDSETGYGIQ